MKKRRKGKNKTTDSMATAEFMAVYGRIDYFDQLMNDISEFLNIKCVSNKVNIIF